MGKLRLRVSAWAMVTARAAIAATVEYRWIARDLIKQPPAMTMARSVPRSGSGIGGLGWCVLQQVVDNDY
jgi:hypothetical protein